MSDDSRKKDKKKKSGKKNKVKDNKVTTRRGTRANPGTGMYTFYICISLWYNCVYTGPFLH